MAAAATHPLVVTPPHLGPDFGPAFKIIDPGAIASTLFYIVIVLVFIYTLVAGYHWLRFGRHSLVTIPALAIHVTVCLALIGFALTGLP